MRNQQTHEHKRKVWDGSRARAPNIWEGAMPFDFVNCPLSFM
jgi:hypothetical protein